MPRVLLGKENNMSKYFTQWINHKKSDEKISNQTIGECLGITSQAFGQKLKNNQYTLDDFVKIIKFFNASEEEIIKLTKV